MIYCQHSRRLRDRESSEQSSVQGLGDPGKKRPGACSRSSQQTAVLQRHRPREQVCGSQEQRGRWEELGDWDWRIYTIDTVYKIHS